MIVFENTYKEMLKKIKPAPPETGGIFGVIDGVVTDFVFDRGLIEAPCCYMPDVNMFNSVIEKWQEENIDFCGIIHSHMPHEKELSKGDVEYIGKILSCMPDGYSELYFPLIIDGEIIPYKAKMSDVGIEIICEEIKILKEDKRL